MTVSIFLFFGFQCIFHPADISGPNSGVIFESILACRGLAQTSLTIYAENTSIVEFRSGIDIAATGRVPFDTDVVNLYVENSTITILHPDPENIEDNKNSLAESYVPNLNIHNIGGEINLNTVVKKDLNVLLIFKTFISHQTQHLNIMCEFQKKTFLYYYVT